MTSCDDILFFIDVVKAGSFNKAALDLDTTQATISRRIQSLEENIQQQLLIRNSRGFTLSEAGKELYKEFEEWGKNLRKDLAKTTSTKRELKGILKIGFFSSFMFKILLPHIHKFTQKHPQVKIIARIVNKQVDLVRDKFDLIISPVLPKSEVAKVKSIFKTQLKLYCSPEYIKTYGQPQNLEELDKHQILKFFADTGEPVEYYMAKHRDQIEDDQLITLQGSLYIRDTIFSNIVIKAGHCISLGIPELVREEISTNHIVEVLPEYSFLDLSFYLIRHNVANNLAEREFINFIESIISEWRK